METRTGERLHFVLSLLVMSAVAACGGGGGGGGGDGTPLATVSGTILDSANQPVSGATVTVAGAPVSVVTDGNGGFSLDAEVGSHGLTAVKGGYTLYFDGSFEVTSGGSVLGGLTPTNPFYATPVTWYADDDGDGYGDVASPSGPSSFPSGVAVLDSADCNDDPVNGATSHPGAAEICDNADNDCDSEADEGNPGGGAPCSTGESGVCAAGIETCSDGLVGCVQVAFPTTEVCGGLDDDCDGLTDGNDPTLSGPAWFADADADTFGAYGPGVVACAQPAGHVADSTDCVDTDPAIHPGATEVCGGIDDDCVGLTDGNDPSLSGPAWFADADGDSFGDAASMTPACAQPSGHVADSTDCNDADGLVNPSTVWYADGDGDGYSDMVPVGPVCEQPAGHDLSGNLVSTIVHDLDDAFATTGVAGKALVSLYYSAELLLVDLATGFTYDAAIYPDIPSPGEAVGIPGGQGAFVLSDINRQVDAYDLSADLLVRSLQLNCGTPEYGYTAPFTGVYADGLLATISYADDFLLWDPAVADTVHANLGAGSLWDVETVSNAGTTLFAVADYSSNKLFILSDSAAVVDSVRYGDGARAIPSTASAPVAVAFSPDGSRLYAANYLSSDLLVFAFDASSGACSYLDSIPLLDSGDGTPAVLYNTHGMVVSADDGTVWVAADASHGVVAVAPGTGEVDHVLLDPSGGTPRPANLSMTLDRRFLLLAGSNLFEARNGGTELIYYVDAAARRPVLAIDVRLLTKDPASAGFQPVAVVPY